MIAYRGFFSVTTLIMSIMLVAVAEPAVAASASGGSGTRTMSSSFAAVDLSRGFYSGVEMGRARNDLPESIANLRADVPDPTDPSATLRITHVVTAGRVDGKSNYARAFFGWLFHVNLALELGVLHLDDIEIDGINYDGDASTSHKVNVDLGAVDLTTKLILPVTDQIRFFTRLGVAYMLASSSDRITLDDIRFKVLKGGEEHFTWVVAVGLSFALSDVLECFFGWSHYAASGNLEDLELLGLGLLYHTN